MRDSRRLAAAALVLAGASLLAADWPAAKAPFYTSRPLTPAGSFTNNAEGPEFTRDGRLFVVNCERDGTICEVHPDGRVEVFVTLPEGSTANAIRETSSGALMLADYKGHNVLRLDVATKRVTTFVHDDRFNQPKDLAITGATCSTRPTRTGPGRPGSCGASTPTRSAQARRDRIGENLP